MSIPGVWENELKISLMAVTALVPVLFLAGLAAGWAMIQERPEPDPPPETTISETVATVPEPPREDVPGEELSGLPRYPDSVRARYERAERHGLILTDVRYLVVGESPDTVRGFYRGVFRSQDWAESDADFSEGVWTFFVTHDEREATVEVEPYEPGVVEISIRLSEPKPRPAERSAPERAPDPAPTPAPDPAPAPAQNQYAPAPSPQYAPQTPYSPPPAPVYGGDDDYDDGGYEDDWGEDD